MDKNQEVIYCEDDGEYRIYCNICDKLCFERFYRKHLNSETHTNNNCKKRINKKMISNNQYEKCIRKKHTIKNPKFFEIDKIFNDYIIHHKKKFDLYLVNCDFKLQIKSNFNPHMKTEYYYKT